MESKKKDRTGLRLVDVKRSIREKVLAMKLQQSGEAEILNKSYQPLIGPLKEFSEAVLHSLPKSVGLKTSPPTTPIQITKTSLLTTPTQSKKIKLSPMLHQSSTPPLPPKPSIAKALFSSPASTSVLIQNQRGASTPQKPPQVEFITSEETFGDSASQDHDDTVVDAPDGGEVEEDGQLAPEAVLEYLEQFPTMLRPLLVEYVIDKGGNICDTSPVTGVNFDINTSKIIVGNTELNIDDEGNITAGGKKFIASKGLYELLFKRDPEDYTIEERDTYIDLLETTNAIYRNHNPNEQVQGINSLKYRNIIKPILNARKRKREEEARNVQPLGEELLGIRDHLDRSGLISRERSNSSSGSYNYLMNPKSYLGSGFGDVKLRVENKPYRYMYWNDPNELIERLCFLHASKRAGNTSHENEIRAIEEELREANIIY